MNRYEVKGVSSMPQIQLLLENTKQLKLLYVEDDIELLNSTSEMFENFFHSVTKATDGEDGLQKYISFKEDNDAFYDLVITDINMPKSNGLQMSEGILKKNPDQPIIITTAYNEYEYLMKAVSLHIEGYLTKPIEQDLLIKTLYKVTRSIADHKLVLKYVDTMEDLNIQLEKKNAELLVKNKELEKSLRILDTVISKEQISLSSNPIKELSQKKISEEKYIQDQLEDLINNDLYELKEILIEIDLNIIEALNQKQDLSITIIPSLVNFFSRYAAVLRFYSFFDDLSSAIENFSHTMTDNKLPESTQSVENIFMLLESFIYVLGKWQNDISSSTSNQLNQFDASIISDIHTITNMWTQADDEVSDDDIDDIFDF